MERWLARLERRFGRYAPGNTTYYLVAIQALVFVVNLVRPGFVDVLALDSGKVLHGQVWRLVTFLVIPISSSPFWVIFALYWLYVMGTALEAQWSAFRYVLFWVVGMACTMALAFGLRLSHVTNEDLLISLSLAFATLFPDYEIRLFFILPVKMKWLGVLTGAMLLYRMGMEPGLRKLVPLVAVGNYLVFFAPTLVQLLRGGARKAAQAGAYSRFRGVPDEGGRPGLRRCAICGVTNADPEVEFRVCSCEKCGKPTEYCLQHARNH